MIVLDGAVIPSHIVNDAVARTTAPGSFWTGIYHCRQVASVSRRSRYLEGGRGKAPVSRLLVCASRVDLSG